MAYESILFCARAALFKSGYRVVRSAGALQINYEPGIYYWIELRTISILDAYRMQRNQAVYDSADFIGDSAALVALEEAEELLKKLRDWLKS